MTGQPTVTVALDDGTGTYPLDVSSRVELQESLSISGVGRTDEFSQAQGTTMSLTLDNRDGAVSVGGGFDSLPFDSMPFDGFGLLTGPTQKIRVIITKGAVSTGFVGRIATLALGWPGGSQAYSTVGITAVDLFADLARRPMRSILEEEVLTDGPLYYYRLSEPTGSTQAGDSSGNAQAPVLELPGGAGQPVDFGAGTGPGTDGLTAATFAGGDYLWGPPWTPPPTYSVGFWFATSGLTAPLTDMPILAIGGAQAIIVGTTGQFAAAGPNVLDGLTHFGLITWDGTTVRYYLDGTLITSGTASPSLFAASTFLVGQGTGGLPAYTGTLSHVAVWPGVLSTFQIGRLYTSAASTESVFNRMQRLCGYAGVTFNDQGLHNDPSGTGSPGPATQVGPQATSGKSTLEALQEVAAAEGGVLYMTYAGALTLQGRDWRPAKTTPDLTIGNDDLSGATALTYDTQQTVNQVTVTRSGGATQVAQDDASMASRGVYAQSLDLISATDADALDLARRILATHTTPTVRVASATFNLLNSPNAEAILGAALVGNRLALSPLPSQAWGGSGDVSLEGWSMTLTQDAWDLTANLLPWSLSAT